MGKGGIIYPENFPPARLLRPAHLMFSKKIFPPARLLCPARLMPSAIDSYSIEPLSTLHSKLKFEW